MKRGALLLDPDLLSWEIEIKRLRKIIKKKDEQIKKLKSGEKIRDLYDALDKKRKMSRDIHLRIGSMKKEILLGEEKYRRLEAVHKKLQEKFEANFGFHKHLISVLGQATGLMEKYDAVRKQSKTLQERVQAAG
jgi:uncharacterized coiled-coil DUF342 family protein